MAFRNPYNPKDRVRVIHSSGSKVFIKKGWTYEDGQLMYVEKGIEPLYEKIQAERDSVDLQAMLARYEAGDDTALNKVQGMYIDAVDLPKTYADIFKVARDAEDIFNAMPVAIKEEFNNNAADYWKAFGTEEFDKTMNAYRAQVLNSHGFEDVNKVDSIKLVKEKMAASEPDPAPVVEEKGVDNGK